MRFRVFMGVLALAALIILSSGEAPGSSKKGSSGGSRPNPNPPKLPQMGGGGGGVRVPGYRPPNYRPPGGGNARVVTVNIDFNFTFNSDVGKVRTIDPPTEFDDKGNIKKLTADELKKLKGDEPDEKKLAGYKSDFSEVRVGDFVQVALSVYKTAARKAPAKKGKAKEEEEEKDVDVGGKDAKKDGKWVVAGQVLGKVTKIDVGNTDSGPKMTVRATLQMVRAGGGGNNNINQTIAPEQAQATLILVGRRPMEAAPPEK